MPSVFFSSGAALIAEAAVFKEGNFRTAEGNMGKSRLEAFSDGVMAIIITIMIL